MTLKLKKSKSFLLNCFRKQFFSIKSLTCFSVSIILFFGISTVFLMNYISFAISNSETNKKIRKNLLENVEKGMDVFFSDVINRVHTTTEKWKLDNFNYPNISYPYNQDYLEFGCSSINSSPFMLYHCYCTYPMDCFCCFKSKFPQPTPVLVGDNHFNYYTPSNYTIVNQNLKISVPFNIWNSPSPHFVKNSQGKPGFMIGFSHVDMTNFMGYTKPFKLKPESNTTYYHVSGLYFGSSLDELLSKSKYTSNTLIYIIDTKKGDLIASSDKTIVPIITKDPITNKFSKINTPLDSNYTFVKTGFKAIKNQNQNDLTKIQTYQNLQFYNGISQYYLDVKRLRVKNRDIKDSIEYYQGLDWLIVMYIPEVDVNLLSMILLIVTIVFTPIFMIVSIIFTLIVISLIVSPLYKILKDFQKVEKMDLESLKDRKYLIHEPVIIQKGFTMMVKKLIKYRAFIPSYILDQEKNLNEDNDESDSGIEIDGNEVDGGEIGINEGKKNGENDKIENENENDVINKIKENDIYSKLSKGESGKISISSFSSSNKKDMKFQKLSSKISSSHSNTNKNLKKNVLFKLGYNYSRITILSIKMLNIEDILFKYDENEFLDAYSIIYNEIKKICSIHKGFFANFSFDDFEITFNTRGSQQKNSHIYAVKCAEKIQSSLLNLKQNSVLKMGEKDIFNEIMFAISIINNKSFFGNIGTELERKFAVFADTNKKIVKNFDFYQYLINDLIKNNEKDSEYFEDKIPIFVDYNINSKLSNNYHIRLISYDINPKDSQNQIFELLSEKEKLADGEWMYKLEHDKNNSIYDNYHNGINSYLNNNFDEALKHLESFIEGKGKGDYVSKMIISIIKIKNHKKSENITESITEKETQR